MVQVQPHASDLPAEVVLLDEHLAWQGILDAIAGRMFLGSDEHRTRLLTHLAGWIDAAIEVLTGPDGRSVDAVAEFRAKLAASGGIDAYNARVWAEGGGAIFSETLAYATDRRKRLSELLTGSPPLDPSVAKFLNGCLANHYREHLDPIHGGVE